MPDAVLIAEDVHKTFRVGGAIGGARVSAVDGVSLRLSPGESLGLVGESGCGKSTLARMLVGLDRPDSGTITVAGYDVTRVRNRDRRALRRQVQMVFQDPYTSLDPRMRVLEIIAEPLRVHRLASGAALRDRVADLLQTVGLAPELMNRFPHQFSGGQRQRIGIARALALEPAVLVCDEPVSALDVSVQAQVVNLLRDLQRRTGIAMVFIAHDLSVVRHVADRTAVMYLGRIAEIGDTATVYDVPAHPYTRALLSASPVVDRAMRGRLKNRVMLTGDPPSPTDPPSGCRFHTRCPLRRELSTMDTGVCESTRPPLTATNGTREAACHFASQAGVGTPG